jgi:hypothetical protein
MSEKRIDLHLWFASDGDAAQVARLIEQPDEHPEKLAR